MAVMAEGCSVALQWADEALHATNARDQRVATRPVGQVLQRLQDDPYGDRRRSGFQAGDHHEEGVVTLDRPL
ncbi:hypothetical protein [Streptomyces sanglieri]|uniref:hypothetical protein n=1 Tax=Streptomyces sanglieri TaxID=193460 RepID=UPI0035267C46